MKKNFTKVILTLGFPIRLYGRFINYLTNEKNYIQQNGVINSCKFESVETESGTFELVRVY